MGNTGADQTTSPLLLQIGKREELPLDEDYLIQPSEDVDDQSYLVCVERNNKFLKFLGRLFSARTIPYEILAPARSPAPQPSTMPGEKRPQTSA